MCPLFIASCIGILAPVSGGVGGVGGVGAGFKVPVDRVDRYVSIVQCLLYRHTVSTEWGGSGRGGVERGRE